MIPVSELVTLEAPDGRTYPVEVSREFGEVVLRSGWHEFVNEHHASLVEHDISLSMFIIWHEPPLYMPKYVGAFYH